MPEKPTETLDPHALLAEALASYREVEALSETLMEGVDDDVSGARAATIMGAGFLQVQALAAVAQAAALLQPSPEEVIEVYRETAAEVMEEEAQKAATARQILQAATRDGSRRHPAIHAALEVLGDG